MIDALRYEIVRIRTIRSTWWITGGAIVIGFAVGLLFGWGGHHDYSQNPPTGDELDHFGAYVVTQLGASGVPNLPGFLVAILGIFAWGHEYRHGMIRASLTALNSRTDLWIAKFLVVGVWTVVVSLVAGLLSGVVAQAYMHPWVDVLDGEAFRVLLWQALANLLLAWIAMAFTALTRSQAFALVAIFLWPLLVESLINVVFNLVPGLKNHTDLTRFLPFAAERRMVSVIDHAHSTFGDPLSHVGGTVIFGGVTVVLMVASYLLFLRRDA